MNRFGRADRQVNPLEPYRTDMDARARTVVLHWLKRRYGSVHKTVRKTVENWPVYHPAPPQNINDYLPLFEAHFQETSGVTLEVFHEKLGREPMNGYG